MKIDFHSNQLFGILLLIMEDIGKNLFQITVTIMYLFYIGIIILSL